jgi:hypothetical protein
LVLEQEPVSVWVPEQALELELEPEWVWASVLASGRLRRN